MNSLILFFFFIPFLAFLLIILNLILAPHKPYNEKASAFECGFHSFLGQNRAQFSISFFLFGLLFLIFDLEIVLIFPYGVSFNSNLSYGLTIIFIFIVILTAGFIFEIGKKALTINSKQTSNILIGLNFVLNSKYNLIKSMHNKLLNLRENNKNDDNRKTNNSYKILKNSREFTNIFFRILSRVMTIGFTLNFIRNCIRYIFEVDVTKDLNNFITVVYYPLSVMIMRYIAYSYNNPKNYLILYLFSLLIIILNLLILIYISELTPSYEYIMLNICFIKKKFFKAKISKAIFKNSFSTSNVLYMDDDGDPDWHSSSPASSDSSDLDPELYDLSDLNDSRIELLRNYLDIICEKHNISKFSNTYFELIEYDQYPDQEQYKKWIKVIRDCHIDILMHIKDELKEWGQEEEYLEECSKDPQKYLDAYEPSTANTAEIEDRTKKLLKYLAIIERNKHNIKSEEMVEFVTDYFKTTNHDYFNKVVLYALLGLQLLGIIGLSLHEPSNLVRWLDLFYW